MCTITPKIPAENQKSALTSLQKPKNPRLNPKNPQNPNFHPVIYHQKPLFFSIYRKKGKNSSKK